MKKNILVATDFSVTAENAAHYAIGLAKEIKAEVTLLNVYKAPADAPMATQVAWPLVSQGDLEQESDSSLIDLVKKLDSKGYDASASFCPQITFESEKGEVCDVVSALVKRKKFDLVVMGMAGAGKLVQWTLGSNSKLMVDEADFPVLYVPYEAKFSKIKKIAFATDLSTDDIEPIQYLCSLAQTLDAALTVYHITSYEAEHADQQQGRSQAFYHKVISKLDYAKLKFENIWDTEINEGLKWIGSNKEIDLVSMVHRQHTLLDKFINGSHVHKYSRLTKVPLLVFQPCEKIYT